MSKTRMYNAHVCVSGIPAFEEMIKSRLDYIAEAIPWMRIVRANSGITTWMVMRTIVPVSS